MTDDFPVSMQQLKTLARAMTGSPEQSLHRLLVLICEQLSMDVAFVSELDGASHRVVRRAVRRDGTVLEEAIGLREPLSDSWCGRVIATDGLLVGDVGDTEDLLALPSTAAFGIRSYAGVALRDADDRVVGTLCALGRQPHANLNPRDLATLTAVGEVLVPLLQVLDHPLVPGPRGVVDLGRLSSLVAASTDVATLAPPLLEALHDVTGLGSTYLTVLHKGADSQEIRFSRNTRDGFALPEGLHVPWSDTLCKRALDEGQPCTVDVPAVWGDSEAARALGIQVYVSVPVELSDGRVWGTLCGADSVAHTGLEDHLGTMRLFARLVAAQVERDLAVTRAEQAALLAREEADTDALTGCASRRVVEPWLSTNLSDLEQDEAVLVAFVDVDRFKAVNDHHGHATGDVVLTQVGEHLRATARPGDLVARWGGDEFILAARVPRRAAEALQRRLAADAGLSLTADGLVLEVALSVGFALSEGHTALELVNAADQAMYAVKRARA